MCPAGTKFHPNACPGFGDAAADAADAAADAAAAADAPGHISHLRWAINPAQPWGMGRGI